MKSLIATLRSLTLPYGSGVGTPRIVIGPDVPAAIVNLSRAGVYPSKWQSSGAPIIAAVLFFDAVNGGDDFFFLGITGPVFDAAGWLLLGYAVGSGPTDTVYIFQEWNAENSREVNGILTAFDMDSSDANATQARVEAFNAHYWGLNDAGPHDNFWPFRVGAYWGTGTTGWGGGNAFTAALPLGKVQTTLGARRLFLAASTGTTIAESVVNTWTDNAANAGISVPTWPVFAGRTYAFRGTMTTQSSTATDIISVKVRQMLGGAPNLGTDPILATLGGDGRGLDWELDGPYEPTADAMLKAYITMTRAGGAGNISLFGNGSKSHWCLEDLGASLL